MRIEQKLKEIEENIEIIYEHLPANKKAFRSLGLIKDGIYKRVEFTIQNYIDIFSLIYSELGLGVPSTLDDIFNSLAAKKIFASSIMKIIHEMKGLRNILIHRYGEINDDMVFEFLTEQKDDFEKVTKTIDAYLNTSR